MRCHYCQKNFESYFPKKFCSRSCAATFNNKHVIKRKKTKKCRKCKTLIASNYTFCPCCINKGYHLRGGKRLDGTRTIQESISKKNDANRYCKIRQHARKITSTRPQVCAVCNYNIHVECCHIKDIAGFPLETQLSIVNAPENLILLCRNHHWEFDNKILQIGAEGVEPTQLLT